MADEKAKNQSVPRTIVIVVLCVSINFFLGLVARHFSLPVWLDSIGTVFAGYSLGPVCGAIVGCTGNIVGSMWNLHTLPYCAVGILIGISSGIAAKRGYFSTLFHTMSVAGVITIISMVVSGILNLFIYSGYTGNLWGDGIIDYLGERSIPRFVSVFVAELYLNFPDKLITVLVIYWGILIINRVKKERIASTAVSALVLLAITAGMFSGLFSDVKSVYAENANKEKSYIQTVFNADNGLPCGHANDVAQTADGILWVGSYSGLYRYNGSGFRFMEEYNMVKNVNCLFVDEEGRLLIGTNDNGLVIAINENVSNCIDAAKGLPSDSVRCIAQGSDGNYYVGTSDSLAVVRLRAGIFIEKKFDNIKFAESISADRNGNVAVVTAEGRLYIIKDGDFAYEITREGEQENISCCAFDEEGRLYAGTKSGRVYIGSLTEDDIEAEAIIECPELTNINNIGFQDIDTAWILGDSGIGTIYDRKEYVFNETGTFSDSIENMCVDYQGNLWFASSRLGLMQLTESAFTDIYADAGLEPEVVNTTAKMGDLLYAGTDSGLHIINLRTEQPIENELTEMLDGVRVRCMISDSRGDLYICTYGAGLLVLKADGEIVSYDTEDSQMGNRVRVCAELSDGTIAVGGNEGLTFIEDGVEVKTIPYGKDLGSAKILCLLELSDGTILAGTDGNGIVKIKNRKVTGYISKDKGLSSRVILRLVHDTETDGVFIVTSNSLCYMKDGVSRVLNNFPYSNNYDAFIAADTGDMFVPGSSGIYVFKRDDLMSGEKFDYLLLNSKKGLMGSITANAWNATDDAGNVYLSTDRGIYSVNALSYRLVKHSYRLMVSRIIVDGEPASFDRSGALILDRDVVTLEFVPEVVNYTLENPNVSYYLEGLDTSWKTVPQSELTRVSYTNLPPGDYVFHLAIFDEESGKILEECTYSFSKEKAVYDNSWFKWYLIIVGVSFVGWLTWFITKTGSERAMELQQARLTIALQQVQMGNETILAIAKTVDAKDSRTSKHSQRVSDYSVLIAARYGFTPEEQENLRKAALLHDIGKIGIPDSILNKPARLTDEEYAIMKTHVTRGAEILKDFTLIDHVVEGARYHHERYDGSGYPEGLKGEDIPLYGRIIAIADAFDAMTATRVYRKRQDFDYVLSELHKGRGKQFDPELLDMFLAIIDEGVIDIKALYDSAPGEEGDKDAKN